MKLSVPNVDEEPLDLTKLKRMAQKFPKDYTSKLEVMLLESDQAVRHLRKENNSLLSQNTILTESNETQKFVVKSLAAALAKAKKTNDEAN
jgi:hypothetical protein